MPDDKSPEGQLVEQSDAIAFCNEAFRNTDWIDTIDTELLDDIQAALATFARHRVAALQSLPDTSEREAIVAWLRRDIEPDFSNCEYPEDYAVKRAGAAIGKASREALADAIERGDHLPIEDKSDD